MKSNKELKALAKQVIIEPKVEMINNDESVDVYLYGSIVSEEPTHWLTGEPEEGEYIFPEQVRNLFDEIEDDKTVNLHLNSGGGDVYASVAISNFIKEQKNTVNVYIDAIAASGASIIAMAGDNVYMYPNSMMMIHRASALAYGNTEELNKVSEDLKKFDEVVLNSYVGRFTGTEDELQALIEDETYFTAQECVSVGLVDEIIEQKKDNAKSVENSGTHDVKVSLLEKYMKPVAEKDAKENILNKFKKEK